MNSIAAFVRHFFPRNRNGHAPTVQPESAETPERTISLTALLEQEPILRGFKAKEVPRFAIREELEALQEDLREAEQVALAEVFVSVSLDSRTGEHELVLDVLPRGPMRKRRWEKFQRRLRSYVAPRSSFSRRQIIVRRLRKPPPP